ncbi:recombinase family protein [Acinetobacter sp. 1125_18A]|uniref:recombinase family protein n=1 Tax=Acinetobacter sp. 1125_18A TaxID=2605959 RepID=UPI004059E881
MKFYAYVRIEPKSKFESDKFLSFLYKYGYKIPKNGLIIEEVLVNKSINSRDLFKNMINYSLSSGDFLVIKSLDCLGNKFEEILSIANQIFEKQIRLICLDYSKNEINGDLRIFFNHFLTLCSQFEKLFNFNNENLNIIVKKNGRPEILSESQKRQVLQYFKRGESINSIAKRFSVTRTVIQRILKVAVENLNNQISFFDTT